MVDSSSTAGNTATMNASTSPCLSMNEKKHWWLSNRKIVDKYIKDARSLIASQEQSEIAAALKLLDAALALSPRLEVALELKARSLLCLRRFKDVADMLQDYIPSLKIANDDSGSISSSDSSSQQLSRERVKLLPSDNSDPSFKCFSVSDLKKKVMAGLCKNCDKEGQWRYLILGQACCHLGLMEDAMVLLQTGKRLTTAAFRRQSISWSEDSFSLSNFPISSDISTLIAPPTPPRNVAESESVTQLLAHIKLLLRRRTAALAALDAGLNSEAIRHFNKILEGRRGAPQGFLAECYMHRAYAYKASGRIAESIADCNKTLALEPACIQALDTRASLLETIRYREIPGKLCALTTKIQELKKRVASGETRNVDYYALIGLRRGCSRSELERAHLLLSLRHKPDKSINFVERCEFADDMDLDSVKDRAKMSALLLYRLLQKGYSNVMSTIMDEEAAEKQRKKAAAVQSQQAAQAAAVQSQQAAAQNAKMESNPSAAEISGSNRSNSNENKVASASSGSTTASVFQGVFCRDLAAVGNLLSQSGFNRPLAVKFEALSC
ncbi:TETRATRICOPEPTIDE REPEAT (TPR)-LIKE SUPERFAMILY PROTEIN [Salix purpurea]|uniref:TETRATRICOPEPTIDE REPEAT (TPR)-LIKE SUPERFAMILY PROTEIN n=1 Tax=Salix purpurea TaxID=77065 RepID=A0A9Q0SRQ0_SALPP|nr:TETRATRICOPEPTIDE REPEAT (TPR)-LIKE SUPERFAMILY PROTEIN [Salix purpurea]